MTIRKPRGIAVCAVVGLLGAALLWVQPGASALPWADGPQRGSSGEAGTESNPEVVVHMVDGQRISAVLVSADDDELVVRIAGIDTRLPMRRVDRYRVLPPVMERYREMRDAIGDDPSQIVQLAEWLRVRGREELALDEAERALELDPDHPEAQRMARLLSMQIELNKRARRSPVLRQEREEGNPRERDDVQSRFPLLDEDQVNLLKVYEVDLSERPRLVIQRETISRLIESYRGNPLIPTTQEGREAIYRKSNGQILDLMFRLQARELYGEVRVLDQPRSMRLFREGVHRTWLINSCSTTACHGGAEAGRLMLHNRRVNSDATVYTNFLILERFRMADGTPLIDYDKPEHSPLLQMGLPRGDSLYPHPEAPRGITGRDAWRPIFRSTDDRRFRRTVEWINSLYRPRPDYPIEYEPPRPSESPEEGEFEPEPRGR